VSARQNLIAKSDQARVAKQLTQTMRAIEEILSNGLTTAGPTTLKTLGVTFQEASRLKLLRLGGTLRNTCEEITRYTKDDANFSAKRLVFFLNRSWILCQGIQRALARDDGPMLERLLWTPSVSEPSDRRVVCLGVVKKVVDGVFCAFEFRLRDVDSGESLVWSTVFPMKPGVEIPAEGYLHLPQNQKFKASVFVGKTVIEISNARVTQNELGSRRIQLGEESQVVAANEFKSWSDLMHWDIDKAIERIRDHKVSPLDVDIEMQEETFWSDYVIEPGTSNDNRLRYPFVTKGVSFELNVSEREEGSATREKLNKLVKTKKQRPVLFGLTHYAQSALEFQPLTLFIDSNPQYITLSEKHVDRSALLRALSFT